MGLTVSRKMAKKFRPLGVKIEKYKTLVVDKVNCIKLYKVILVL